MLLCWLNRLPLSKKSLVLSSNREVGRPLRSSSPDISPSLPCPPTVSLSAPSSRFLKTSRDSEWLHLLPGQPLPVPVHSHGEEILPNVQAGPSLAQLEDVHSCPNTVTWEKGLTPTLLQLHLSSGVMLGHQSGPFLHCAVVNLNESPQLKTFQWNWSHF